MRRGHCSCLGEVMKLPFGLKMACNVARRLLRSENRALDLMPGRRETSKVRRPPSVSVHLFAVNAYQDIYLLSHPPSTDLSTSTSKRCFLLAYLSCHDGSSRRESDHGAVSYAPHAISISMQHSSRHEAIRPQDNPVVVPSPCRIASRE